MADLRPEQPSVSAEKGIEILQHQHKRWVELSSREIDGRTFTLSLSVNDIEYQSWLSVTRFCIEKAFGRNHPNIEEFLSVRGTASFNQDAPRIDDVWSKQARLIQGYVEQLLIEIATRPFPVKPDPVAQEVSIERSKKVFIVHGHDGELKEATARLVAQLDLEPIILHERARQGRAIIENFSIHAKASSFALVLLTADDVGSLGSVERHAALQPRARQNVVFEMGFFFGLLGQGRVCAIYDVGVEMPSDLGGILYIPYDAPSASGRWRWDVAKEIQAAGYDVDLNKL